MNKISKLLAMNYFTYGYLLNIDPLNPNIKVLLRVCKKPVVKKLKSTNVWKI